MTAEEWDADNPINVPVIQSCHLERELGLLRRGNLPHGFLVCGHGAFTWDLVMDIAWKK